MGLTWSDQSDEPVRVHGITAGDIVAAALLVGFFVGFGVALATDLRATPADAVTSISITAPPNYERQNEH